MKFRLIVLWCSIVFCLVSRTNYACSTFCFETPDGPVFGKNYDWRVEDGLIIVNKRNVAKIAAMGEPGVTWESKYGSVTFNQYGREFAHGGMNEAGLVVEPMWLDETEYPQVDERPEIDNLQWIQYQLDNFSTVEDVIASNTRIRIVPNGAKIHYLICDLSGTCATIEFLEGEMHDHTGETLPFNVLTNSTYTDSIRSVKRYEKLGGTLPLGTSNSSLDRFSRAVVWLKNANFPGSGDPINYGFTILEDLAQGDYTKWSIVYDMGRKRIYFRTRLNPSIRYLDLSSFNFSCQSLVKVLDINVDGAGDVNRSFLDYSWQINRDLLENSFRKTDFLSGIPDEALDLTSSYVETTTCQNP